MFLAVLCVCVFFKFVFFWLGFYLCFLCARFSVVFPVGFLFRWVLLSFRWLLGVSLWCPGSASYKIYTT